MVFPTSSAGVDGEWCVAEPPYRLSWTTSAELPNRSISRST